MAMSDLSEAELDSILSYEFACSCLRVEQESGRKLSPKEMVERVDTEDGRCRKSGPGARAPHGAAEEASPPSASPPIARDGA